MRGSYYRTVFVFYLLSQIVIQGKSLWVGPANPYFLAAIVILTILFLLANLQIQQKARQQLLEIKVKMVLRRLTFNSILTSSSS